MKSKFKKVINMNKYKFLFIFSLFVLFNMLNSNVKAAISEKFRFVINTIGIPEYNIYREEINEEIYYEYNTFVYSSPKRIGTMTNLQRFKSVPVTGKWTKEYDRYKGYGTRGEYNILGMNYSGGYVYNIFFPMDGFPETTPDKWRYIFVSGAYETWKVNKNISMEQINYMKNTDMLYSKVTYYNYTNNIYEPYSYGLSANKIGLEKVKLHTPSTWKTTGVLYINRLAENGKVYYATFITAPMAASADILSVVNVKDTVTVESDKEEGNINIEFGAKAINLNNYAKPSHIKNITSIIYIDNVEVARVSGSKTEKISKYINYKVSRTSKNIEENLKLLTKEINIKIKSYMYTEFGVDGLLENEVNKKIKINFMPKKFEPFETAQLKVLKKDQNSNMVVSPLITTYETNSKNSQGLIELGRFLAIKVNLNYSSNKKENFKIYFDGKEVDIKRYIEDEKLKNTKKASIMVIKVPNDVVNTLNTWTSLREKNNSYFKINFKEVGKRIKDPHVLKIKYELNTNIYEEELKVDVIDNFEENINYIFDNAVINKENINITQKIEEFLDE